MTLDTNSYKNGSLRFNSIPFFTALLNNLLRTYPLPSFDKTTPSDIANTIVLI